MAKQTVGTKSVPDVRLMCDCCGTEVLDGDSALVVDFYFGYGCGLDGDKGSTDFCQPCAIKVLTVLQQNFANISWTNKQ